MSPSVRRQDRAGDAAPRRRVHSWVAIGGVACLAYLIAHELVMNYVIPEYRLANIGCFDLFFPRAERCDRVLTIKKYLPNAVGALAAALMVVVLMKGRRGQLLTDRLGVRLIRGAVTFAVVLMIGVATSSGGGPLTEAVGVTDLLAELVLVFTVLVLSVVGVFVLMGYVAQAVATRLFEHRPLAQPSISLALGVGLIVWIALNGSSVPFWIAGGCALVAALAPLPPSQASEG